MEIKEEQTFIPTNHPNPGQFRKRGEVWLWEGWRREGGLEGASEAEEGGGRRWRLVWMMGKGGEETAFQKDPTRTQLYFLKKYLETIDPSGLFTDRISFYCTLLSCRETRGTGRGWLVWKERGGGEKKTERKHTPRDENG